jgi:cellulose synthase/poly-beta-1,6-N-acetylglucosamine synthase-like glycosyltransferase
MEGVAPRYSIIIPAYNETAVIGDCVRAIARQSVPRQQYEIIVVDDASLDETSQVAKSAGADRVFRIEHGGAAAARNAGLNVARGELVLFTDADCFPSYAWLSRMIEPFSDPGVVGTKGTYRTDQRSLIARLAQLEFEYRYERMAALPKIDFIDTYAAAYRRQVLLDEGGFDRAYAAATVEDVDLSFRLAQKGYRMIFVPDAWVTHLHPAGLFPYLRRKMRFGYWRALLYLRYPNKISGDAHTDPMLKPQFMLVALMLLLFIGAIFWRVMFLGVVILFLVFMGTTLPFALWAWKRDRGVAVAWPFVTFMRVLIQGFGLAVGFIVHALR